MYNELRHKFLLIYNFAHFRENLFLIHSQYSFVCFKFKLNFPEIERNAFYRLKIDSQIEKFKFKNINLEQKCFL
jgi:hypothetical protein